MRKEEQPIPVPPPTLKLRPAGPSLPPRKSSEQSTVEHQRNLALQVGLGPPAHPVVYQRFDDTACCQTRKHLFGGISCSDTYFQTAGQCPDCGNGGGRRKTEAGVQHGTRTPCAAQRKRSSGGNGSRTPRPHRCHPLRQGKFFQKRRQHANLSDLFHKRTCLAKMRSTAAKIVGRCAGGAGREEAKPGEDFGIVTVCQLCSDKRVC